MTSKQEMATRARKKKRTVTTLAKALKGQRKLSPTRKKALTERQQQMRKRSLLKSRKQKASLSLTPAQRKMMANMPKNKKSLTEAEKRKIRILKAKAVTANAKASGARMDKRIAEIKKGK